MAGYGAGPMRRIITIALVVLVLSSACSGEEGGAPSSTMGAAGEASLLAALAASGRAQPGGWVESAGVFAFVSPRYETGVLDPEAAAWAYLEAFATSYGVADVRSRLTVVEVVPTVVGTVVRLDQMLDGLPVFAGQLAVVVEDDGTVSRVTGVVVPDTDLPDATVTADAAVAMALAATGSTGGGGVAPELVAHAPAVELESGDPRPAWSMVVTVVESSVPMEVGVVVDAVDGTVLLVFGLDEDAESWDLSDAKNTLDDEGKATIAEAELVYEAVDGVTTLVGEDDPVSRTLSEHMSATWRYFSQVHGRDSFDDAGGACKLYVRVGVGWNNASRAKPCTLRFGDGARFAEELDVMAHEFTHAVVGSTAGLVYEGQSGALNEHYADFFAAMVDRSDWLMGGQATGVIRDLSNPRVAHQDVFVVTEDDHGGVHTNSGIPNMAAYLATNPGTNRHATSGVEVVGIGREKGERLWYATLLGLTPRTGFAAWACATIETARAMSPDDLSFEEVASVVAAMEAVGLVESGGPRPVCSGPFGLGVGDGGGGDGGTSTTVPATTVPATTTTVPETTTTNAAACDIVGTWRLRSQHFLDQMAAAAGPELREIQYLDGDYLVEFAADGSYAHQRVAWRIRVVGEATLVVRMDSDEAGTWEGDADTVLIDSRGVRDATVEIWLEQGGSLVPVPGGSMGVELDAVSGAGTWECVDDVLTVTTTNDEANAVAMFDRNR